MADTWEARWSCSAPAKLCSVRSCDAHALDRYKVLSLLFQAGWKHMLLWWFIGVVLAGLLSELRVLPLPLSIQPEFTEFHAHHCPFFPWCFIAAFVCSFMGLLLAPYFPNICGQRTMCFLDVVSIHQVDQELMERGIYGLGASHIQYPRACADHRSLVSLAQADFFGSPRSCGSFGLPPTSRGRIMFLHPKRPCHPPLMLC